MNCPHCDTEGMTVRSMVQEFVPVPVLYCPCCRQVWDPTQRSTCESEVG